MTERELVNRLRDIERELLEVRRTIGNLPVRFANGGAGEALPEGTGRYKCLQLTDDLEPGTPGYDYPRFKQVAPEGNGEGDGE